MRGAAASHVFAMVAACVAIAGVSPRARAATGTWAGAPAATWDTTSSNWTGVAGAAWNAVNGPTNVANFSASATVTLGSTVYASSITPAAGAQIGIAVNGTDDFTINAPWTQTSTTGSIVNKTGTGRLTLAGSVTLVGSANATLNAGITVADGGELVLTGALKAADTEQWETRFNFTNQVGATTSGNVLRIAGAAGNTVYAGGMTIGGTAGNNRLYLTRPGTLETPSYLMAGRSAQVNVGVSSSGNYLEISNGAYFYGQQGGGGQAFGIGVDVGADDNEVRITGPGSTMDRSGITGSAINAGAAGSNNRVVVANGGTLIPRRIGIGTAGGDDNSIRVTGAGSLLNMSLPADDPQSLIEIGRASGSTGNSLLIDDGGTFESLGEVPRGYMVGPVDGSDDNFIRVSGTGSTFTLRQAQPLAIGGIAGQNNGNNSIIDSTAANNRLDIVNGARASQGGIYLLGVNSAVNLGNGVGISELEVRRSGTDPAFGTGVVLSKADSRLTMDSGRLLAGLDNVSMVNGVGQVALVGTGYFHTDQPGGNSADAEISGSGGLVKQGTGRLRITGANTYSGATTIAAGTLELGEFGTLGLGSYSGAIANAADFVVSTSADQVLSGAISGTGRLQKAGFGKLTLSGTNTYSGTTTVSAGTLLVNGTNAGSGAVTTTFGTILGGSGRIDADTTVGGLHSPGNSPGVQTFGGDLTYTTGATVLWELAANTDSGRGTLFDGIDVDGDLEFPVFSTTTLELNFASSGAVDWSNGFWGASRQWVIYDVAGTMTNTAGLTLLTDNWMDASGQFFADVLPESSFALQTSPASGQILLTYSAPVPEPAVLGVAGLAAAAFLARRLWRRGQRGGS